jgi:hypothetical protein
MTSTVEHSVEIAAPVAEVFAYVDDYTLTKEPGGPAGKAMAAAVKPFIGIAVKHTSEALVRNVEAR